MLDDKPRKLLTIMWNFSKNYGRVQSIEELVRRLGWSRNEIISSLRVLADRGFIIWDQRRHNEMTFIKSSGLDFNSPVEPRTPTAQYMEYTP